MRGQQPQARMVAVVLIVVLSLMLSVLAAGCGANSAATSQSPQAKLAAKRGYVLIGVVAPLTGPLATLGVGMNWATKRAVDAVNKKGGIFIKALGKKLPVRLMTVDCQSDPTKAAGVAAQLITKDKVDMLVAYYTPAVANPADAMAERYGMPAVSLGEPNDSFLTGGTHKWSYNVFWSQKATVDLSVGELKQYAGRMGKVVGIFCPNNTDGVARARLYHQELAAAGYTIVDPGRFPADTNDFTSMILQFKKNHVDSVVAVAPPPTFATFWRQCHEQGFIPKFAYEGLAVMMPGDAAALGDHLAAGLNTEVWWSPDFPFKSSITGETAKDLAAAWTSASGKEWTEAIGMDYGGIEIAVDALARAQSVDPGKLVQSIARTSLNTVLGSIKFNAQHFAETPLVGGQWAKGTKFPWDLRIVYDAPHPQIPTTAKMIFPLPQ